MYEYNAEVPSRRVCHSMFTWKVRNLCFAEQFIKADGLWSRAFPANDESSLEWKMGIHEQEGKKLSIKLKYTFLEENLRSTFERLYKRSNDTVVIPVVCANIFLLARIPSMGVEVSRFYSGYIKEEIPVEFRLNNSFSEYAKYMEKKNNVLQSDFEWSFILDIICYEDRYSPNYSCNGALMGKKAPGRSTQIGIDLFKYACNNKFADINLVLDTTEIPAHKAILKARCGVDSSSIGKLRQTKSYEVLYYFLLFLYCGNLEILMDVGVLPNGLVEFAEKMGVEDLAKITNRFQFFDSVTFNFRPMAATMFLPIRFFRTEQETLSITCCYRHPYQKWKVQFELYNTPGPTRGKQFLDISIELLKGDRQVDLILEASIFDDFGEAYKRSVFRRLTPGCRTVRMKRFVSKAFIASKYRHLLPHETVKVELYLQSGSNLYYDMKLVPRPPQPIRDDPYIQPCSAQDPRNSSRSPEQNTYGNGNLQSSFGSIQRHRIEMIRSIPSTKDHLDCAKLSRDFGEMLNQVEFSDIEITCGSDIYNAHKVMLAARSKYFQDILDNSNPTMEMHSITSSENMQELLLEIYGANARTPQEITRLIEMYCLAVKHGFSHFFHRCRNELVKNMTVSNCIRIFKLACDHEDEILKEFVMQTFHSRANEIYETEDWLRISSIDEKMANEFHARLEQHP